MPTVNAQPATVFTSVPSPAFAPAIIDPAQAAVRVIDHLNRTTHQHLPTNGATARLVRRRLAHYSAQD